MYVNKCIKCGREFETKNPKRVICPDCLYPDKNMMIDSSEESKPAQQGTVQPRAENETAPQFYSSYSAGGDDEDRRPPRQYNHQGGYNQGYNRPRQNNYNRQGGYGNNRPQQGGFNNNRRPQNNRFNNNRRPQNNRNKAPKQLLVSREQLEQIELLYKLMLPLPNPDAHEVIGEKIGLEPRKLFF